jgi:hypothetical protein
MHFSRHMTPRQRLRLTGALLVLWALAYAAPATAADALAQDMKARLEKSDPALSVQIEGQDRLVLKKDGKNAGMMDLANLREICAKSTPAVCADQKQRRVELQGQANALGRPPFSREALRLVVRPAGYGQAVERQLARVAQGGSASEQAKVRESVPMLRSLGPYFVMAWVQDFAQAMTPVSIAAMKESGLSTAELDRLGADNLRLEQVTPLKPLGKAPSVLSTEGNDYLSSILVDEAFWQRVAGPHAQEDVAVCLPARHELMVYVPALDASKGIDFPKMCAAMAQSAAPTFSDRVIRRANRQWLLN